MLPGDDIGDDLHRAIEGSAVDTLPSGGAKRRRQIVRKRDVRQGVTHHIGYPEGDSYERSIGDDAEGIGAVNQGNVDSAIGNIVVNRWGLKRIGETTGVN